MGAISWKNYFLSLSHVQDANRSSQPDQLSTHTFIFTTHQDSCSTSVVVRASAALDTDLWKTLTQTQVLIRATPAWRSRARHNVEQNSFTGQLRWWRSFWLDELQHAVRSEPITARIHSSLSLTHTHIHTCTHTAPPDKSLICFWLFFSVSAGLNL